jgi:hypothetical protein
MAPGQSPTFLPPSVAMRHEIPPTSIDRKISVPGSSP